MRVLKWSLFLLPLSLSGQELADRVALDEVLTRYVEKQGGRSYFDQLSSAILVGNVETADDNSVEFKTAYRLPDKKRTIFESESRKWVVTANGPVQWRSLPSNRSVTILDPVHPQSNHLMGPLFLAAVRPNFEDQISLFKETQEIDGFETHVVELENAYGHFRFFLDVEENIERRVDFLNQNGELESYQIFKVFREVDEFFIPHLIEDYDASGHLQQTTTIEEVRLNPGVLSLVFQKPPEIAQTEES